MPPHPRKNFSCQINYLPRVPFPRQRDDLVQYADVAFQVMASQISNNYLKFIKSNLIPKLGEHANIPLRELRTLMCIAHFETAISGAVIAQVMGYDPATVTRSTRWLIDEGFVKAETNLKDARSILYGLKPRGADVSTLYREVSKTAVKELNHLDDDLPNMYEIEKALNVMVRIRNRPQVAAKKSAQTKRARSSKK